MTRDTGRDLRIVIRTPDRVVVDTVATHVEVEDTLGRFVVDDLSPNLAALTPSEVTVVRRDGSRVSVQVGWGTLTAVGTEARLIVDRAAVTAVALPASAPSRVTEPPMPLAV
ncbi:MAG: hypothetical protein AAF928_11435 [Myxococcota bacterium]